NSKIAYPQDVIFRSVFFALVLYIFTQLWGALLGSTGTIEGFSRVQMVWYLMVTESIMLSNARIERRIDDEIKSGAIAYALIRPLHFVWYQFSIYVGETLGHLLFNIMVGGALAWALVGSPAMTAIALPAIFLSVALAFSLQFLVKMSIALTAFWIEDTGPFFWIYSKLLFTLGGLFVPIDFYPMWLQKIARALPINYILYAPAKLFVTFDTSPFFQIVLWQSLWCVVLTILVLTIYKRGVKRVSVNGG
ncbi:MAG: hypothetical protein Q8N36_04540, partial [bacterium]|nr:hypothetical protein [bacterium]